VHALERGEFAVPDFERELAARLRTHEGRPVEAEGLLARMFAGFEREPAMVGVVRRARSAGLRTALLSNSWGLDYPREGWDELFDAVVISGEVGMRKPEPRIYRHTAARLGVEPSECVFVDDLRPNVVGAVDVGMVGVHHITPDDTVLELEALFGIPLRSGSDVVG
jgi:putative hydrolase of the HAD superfamily